MLDVDAMVKNIHHNICTNTKKPLVPAKSVRSKLTNLLNTQDVQSQLST